MYFIEVSLDGVTTTSDQLPQPQGPQAPQTSGVLHTVAGTTTATCPPIIQPGAIARTEIA